MGAQVSVRTSLARWLSYGWPGFPQLWRQGSWAGLAAALSWGLLANWLLAATFVWTEVASLPLIQVGWATLAASWAAGVVLAVRWNWQVAAAANDQRTTDMLRTAQIEYLRGNWLVAEAQLEDILAIDASDIEAQLLLASLYRHTDRTLKAGERLRSLQRLAGAKRWQHEIESERRLLNENDEPDVLPLDGNTTIGEPPITQIESDRNNTVNQQQAAA